MSGFNDVNIDRLNLRLPTGFEARANGIARLAVKELANKNWHSAVNLHSLSIDTVRIAGNESNRAVAARIATAIYQQAHAQSAQENGMHSSSKQALATKATHHAT